MVLDMKLPISLTIVAAAGICAVRIEERQSVWTVGQAVQTTSGSISGHAATINSQVSEYLGIPYAEAPIGNLRFAAPVAFTSNATIDGSAFVSPHSEEGIGMG